FEVGSEAILPRPGFLPEGQGNRQVQAAGEHDGGRRFPRLHVRQGVEETTGRNGREECASLTCTATPAPRNGSHARAPTSRRSPSTGSANGWGRPKIR